MHILVSLLFLFVLATPVASSQDEWGVRLSVPGFQPAVPESV